MAKNKHSEFAAFVSSEGKTRRSAYFDIAYVPGYETQAGKCLLQLNITKQGFLTFDIVEYGKLSANNQAIHGLEDYYTIRKYIEQNFKDIIFAECIDGSGDDLILEIIA